ncbi:MAG: branched-chain alpha-keto acid dehydrogenase subunit E2, partial [Pseudomonadota bacterium]
MWKSLASNFLTLLIVILVISGGVIYWGQRTWVTPGPLAETICVSVPRGANMTGISEQLAERGAITDARLFRVGSDYTERSQRLKAGNFLVPAGASMEQISLLLSASGQSTCGADVNYRIGVTLAEIQVREINPATGRFEVTAEFLPEDPRPAVYQEFLDDGFGGVRVTVAEGATSWQIANALERLDILNGETGSLP